MLKLEKSHIITDSELELTLTESIKGFCTIIDWSVKNISSEIFHGVIVLQKEMPDCFRTPWIMIPGYLYGEEQVDNSTHVNYPVLELLRKNPDGMRSSWWIVPADRTASPLVYLHESGKGFAFASEPHYRICGDVLSDDCEPQIGIGFSSVTDDRFLKVTIPACEEPFTHTNTDDISPSINRLTMTPGSSVNGRIMVYDTTGDRHCYQSILEHYYNEMLKKHQPAKLPDIDSLVEDTIYGIVDGHYDPQQNFFIYSRSYDPLAEQIANTRGGCSLEWHTMLTGFANGLPVCHALLKGSAGTGDPRGRSVALKVVDKFCSDGISPSGLFWADWVPETIETINGSFPNPFFSDRDHWGSGWLPEKTWVHTRTIADACYHLASMIIMESDSDEHDLSHLSLWKMALRSNLEVILGLQLDNGSYGQCYEAEQRRVVKEDGCGGLLWISAFIKARNVYRDDQTFIARIDKSLRSAAEAYAGNVYAERIWGAPEDTDSPTSEDGLNAVMAYCDLYELYNDYRYLELATIAADWMLTFRKTYNQILPENTIIGRYNMKSMGGDFASVANSHLHVYEVVVTQHLCNLSRWTGKIYYRDRAREHWAFSCQYLSRCDGMYNGSRGAMAEQFYWTNWVSWGDWKPPLYHRQKGNMGAITAVWCLAVLLLAADDAHHEFYLD